MTVKTKLLGSGTITSVLLVGILLLTLYFFYELGIGFRQIVTQASASVDNSNHATAKIGEVNHELGTLSGVMSTMAEDITRTNQRLKITERKIKALTDQLTELSETTEALYEELPEGEAQEIVEEIADEISDIQETMKREALVSLIEAAQNMAQFSGNLSGEVGGLRQLSQDLHQTDGLSRTVSEANQKIQELSQSFQGNITVKRNLLIGILLAITTLVMLMVALITRKISTSVNTVIDQLAFSTGEMTELSTFFRQASVALSSGTADQAQRIEETSTALEEVASLSRNTAEHTVKAQELTHSTIDEMETLGNAMSEIKQSSNNITGIIKTIDTIAFQTNILSLNAAVEAARAGEAGTGFAVVAEEVRRLAGQSSVAAQDITQRIEDSSAKAEFGVKSMGAVKDAFSAINQRINEINTANHEQTIGIGQINDAISHVSVVTQQNAASAEENAATSRRLFEQAESVQGITYGLGQLIGSLKAESEQNSSTTHNVSLTATPPGFEENKAGATFLPKKANSTASSL